MVLYCVVHSMLSAAVVVVGLLWSPPVTVYACVFSNSALLQRTKRRRNTSICRFAKGSRHGNQRSWQTACALFLFLHGSPLMRDVVLCPRPRLHKKWLTTHDTRKSKFGHGHAEQQALQVKEVLEV